MHPAATAVAFAALLLAACGDAPAPAPAAPPRGPQALEHDYGVIPHGETRSHDFALDAQLLDGDWIPLHVQLDCSCGHASLWLRSVDGGERAVDGRPSIDNAPRDGERIVARVTIDTGLREAVDTAKAVSRGYVVLQSPQDPTGAERVRWPLLLRFGIDAPVALHPFAALDFGRVPVCCTGEVSTTLSGDEHHSQIAFGAIVVSDPALSAVLEPDGDHSVLRVRCRPGQLGNHRGTVRIATDLASGYTVVVPVTWKVVPAIEVVPMPKLSFRADLDRAQLEHETVGQFVVVTDHDPSRSAEFRVLRLVDGAGNDAAAQFAWRFEPIPGQPRQHRLHVRYLGGAPDGFRGHIELAKPGDDAALLSIELVVFPR